VFCWTICVIISNVQGNRMRCAGAGRRAAPCLTAFSKSLSNTSQLTNRSNIPLRTADIIDGIERTLEVVSTVTDEHHQILMCRELSQCFVGKRTSTVCVNEGGPFFPGTLV